MNKRVSKKSIRVPREDLVGMVKHNEKIKSRGSRISMLALSINENNNYIGLETLSNLSKYMLGSGIRQSELGINPPIPVESVQWEENKDMYDTKEEFESEFEQIIDDMVEKHVPELGECIDLEHYQVKVVENK